jgi:spore germination cell wall hydrolase CwlJ-like protein
MSIKISYDVFVGNFVFTKRVFFLVVSRIFMTQNFLPLRARKAQKAFSFANISLAVFVTSFSYIAATQSAHNPESADLPASGNPVLISQTFDSLNDLQTDEITTSAFVIGASGVSASRPNRKDKVDRNRPKTDIVEFASSFSQARTHIALAREEVIQTEVKITIVAKKKTVSPVKETRIHVASIDMNIMSDALNAIEKVDKSNSDRLLPSPLIASKALAYGRANTPATEFNTPVAMKVSKKQLQCLSTAIYFEARGEPYRGQVAVAQVVMNRVKHKLYPNTICGVVFQNQHRRNACQFSFACDGIPERTNEKKAWTQSQEIAKKVVSGSIYLTEVDNATHYHANYVRPKWARKMNKLTVIGVHKFFRFKKGWNWS